MRSRLGFTVLLTLSVILVVPVAAAQPAAQPPPTAQSAAQTAAEDPVETVARVRVQSTAALLRMAADGIDVTHQVSQGPRGTFDATVIVPRDDVDVLAGYDARVLDTMAAPTQAEVASELKGNAGALTAAQKRRAKPPATSGDTSRISAGSQATAANGSLTVLRADRWTSADGDFLSVEVRSALGPDDTVTVETDTGERYTLSAFTDRGVYLYHRMTEPAPTDGTVGSITATSSDETSVESPTTEWATGDVSGFPPGFEWGFTDDGYVDATQADAVIEDLAEQYPDLAEIVELPNPTHGYNVPDGSPLLAPASYPREPYTVKALRIGADRDGSKTGVLLYAQEHAREWVTSLVALEAAQRLLHNYGSDPTTTALVDDLDIFIVPMTNPDGAAYSLYDNLLQRTQHVTCRLDCDYVTPLNAGAPTSTATSPWARCSTATSVRRRNAPTPVTPASSELSESESSQRGVADRETSRTSSSR